ncbi:SDR family oxidoreductase [Saccharothrix sp. HUAS TT1]|uniref:SDR family oxidoreductase n=1 Tax=unclassified Saccharothrix TaxID=2593673 RepID=UPI00345B663A
MIVVTGATGNVGRALVRALVGAGERVTAVSRSISADDVPAGIRTLRADLAEPDGLRPALDGAAALFLPTSGESTAADDSAAALRDVLELAGAGGVERVVLLSSQGVGTGRHSPRLEDVVERSGPEWTVLRPGGFASNAFAWASAVREQRLVAAPFADVTLPVVDPDDIAEVATAALREPGHAGRTYVLTGPEAVSPRQQAAAIGAALGEPVRFAELTRAPHRPARQSTPCINRWMAFVATTSATPRPIATAPSTPKYATAFSSL